MEGVSTKVWKSIILLIFLLTGVPKQQFITVNPFGAVGKYINHFIFLKFLDIKRKRNPKYFLDIK